MQIPADVIRINSYIVGCKYKLGIGADAYSSELIVT